MQDKNLQLLMQVLLDYRLVGLVAKVNLRDRMQQSLHRLHMPLLLQKVHKFLRVSFSLATSSWPDRM